MSERNEAILLTSPGAAAIAVVRLRGPKVRGFLTRHFSARVPALMRCRHGELKDENGQVIDDPVIVLSDDGNTADLNLHGGTWVVNATLAAAKTFGFDLPPSMVDASTTIEQEVLAFLPLATTELALKVLLNQVDAWTPLEGEAPAEPSSRHAQGAARQEPRPPAEIQRIVTDCSLHWLLHPPRVAIVGAPNVGKSTLANQLFARERSITADLPGTTRDWVGEIANLDGLAVMLVDTPGLRETDDAIEREAIARGRTQIDRADLIVHVLDVTQPPREVSFDALPVIRVLNKCDLPSKFAAGVNDVKVCAKSGEGIAGLIERIKQFFGCASMDVTQPRCWTERQREWLRQLK